MNGLYDYKKYAILYVDDEEKSLKYFTMAFEKQFRVYTALNAQEGFRLLEEHRDEIGLLLTDQRMPGEKGVQLLERARQLRPQILRFLVTAYADMDAAVAAVNSGAIYKYVSKPWDIPQLEMTLRRALEFFMVQKERDNLLREKLSVLHNMVITDRVLSLGVLAAGLSHHIRNSLVAVQMFLELAPAMMEAEKMDVNALRNPNFWQEFYAHAQQQVGRITELLGALCLASQKPPYQFPDSVQISPVVRDVLARLNSQFAARQITVHNRLAEDLPQLMVDLPKITRLFELLLLDEATSLPAGAQLTLQARPTAEPAGIEVEVSDNGPGLPEESLRAIFDPFFVRHDDPKEFGINLMACY
jgi:two-component system probable response regulator PhcQ